MLAEDLLGVSVVADGANEKFIQFVTTSVSAVGHDGNSVTIF